MIGSGNISADFTMDPRPPRDPGVYVFLDASDRIMYAGMAHDLEAALYRYKRLKGRQAMRDRLAVGSFARVAWLACPAAEVVPTLERVMISRFRPPWNGQHNLLPRSEPDAVVFDESQKAWLQEATSRLTAFVRDLIPRDR